MSQYYDIDAILTDSQKIPCTFQLDVPGLGFLSGSAGTEMKRGTRVELPIWLGHNLVVGTGPGSETLVNAEPPDALSSRVLNALKADARTIDIRAIAPYFYNLGAKVLEISEEEEIISTLIESFKQRAAEIADQGLTPNGALGDGADFESGLDETERQLSKLLVIAVVAVAIVVSITDTKYLFHIHVDPHLWQYKQWWRLLIWQGCYTNSTEVLFAATTLYNLRLIERLWGTRKFLTFILRTLPYTLILTPLILALVIRPLSFNHLNHLPAGPTPIIFALLAQYHAAIPHVYKYRVASGPPTQNNTQHALTFSDKSTTYLVAAQLALAQLPGSALSAASGWIVGYAWRNELLPGAGGRWRVPAWMVLEKDGPHGYEGLRRRLEGEGDAVRASGVEERGEGVQRRSMGGQLLDQIRGSV
ncbi:MAG: hypothetical protein M1825_003981 [Sarcosagium campestre]|nr:MAG: hypothetical protein M1825_003981 [Sarcosagium campestre]